MRQILAPEPDYGAETAQLEMSMDGIWDFMNQVSTRSTISSLATEITKLRSVSKSAMVEIEDGKNCGVSAATTKP